MITLSRLLLYYGLLTLFCVLFKQWLLAGEFSEFEYSHETRRFWRVRVLTKTAVFRNVRDSPDSPTFAKPCCADLPDSQTFAKSCCADLPDSPTFAKPCCADSPDSQKGVWQVLHEFSESGESGEFGECRIDRFIHIKYVICAKNDLSYHACLRRAVLRRLARLADIRQAVLRGLAKLANICRAVLRRPAKLANIRQTNYRVLADIRQTPFLRKM